MERSIESAKLQGFKWSQLNYDFYDDESKKYVIKCLIDEITYNTLLQRYKEIIKPFDRKHEIPFEIDYYLIETNTGTINADWMNSRFQKYVVALQTGIDVEKAKAEVAKTFSTLSPSCSSSIFMVPLPNPPIFITILSIYFFIAFSTLCLKLNDVKIEMLFSSAILLMLNPSIKL